MLTTGRPSGEYNRRVIIQTNTPVAAADGQMAPAWTTYAERWANIEAAGASESFRNHKMSADVDLVVRVHSDPETRAITSDMRLVTDDPTPQTLNIAGAIDPEGRRFEVEIHCKRRTQ